jgi:hypothetical protein
MRCCLFCCSFWLLPGSTRFFEWPVKSRWPGELLYCQSKNHRSRRRSSMPLLSSPIIIGLFRWTEAGVRDFGPSGQIIRVSSVTCQSLGSNLKTQLWLKIDKTIILVLIFKTYIFVILIGDGREHACHPELHTATRGDGIPRPWHQNHWRSRPYPCICGKRRQTVAHCCRQ